MVGIRTCSKLVAKVGHAEILELLFSIGIFEILAKSSGSMIQLGQGCQILHSHTQVPPERSRQGVGAGHESSNFAASHYLT